MNFIMPRDRVVVSKMGRAYEFKKGEPLHVAPMCWDEVIAAGAVPEDELPADDAKDIKAPQGPERAALIKEAIEKMVLRGQREDFGANGAPNAAALSAMVGFTVDAKERDGAWKLAQNEE
jgi:hypothetical protein